MTLVERLPDLDKTQLANLLANANRLQSQAGAAGDAARELLPALEAEIARRRPAPAAKKPAAKKRAPTPEADA